MDKQNFDTTVNSLFSGMDHVLSSKTVVGEPQVIGDTIILPLVDISFGMGAGPLIKKREAVQAVESEVKCPQVLF